MNDQEQQGMPPEMPQQPPMPEQAPQQPMPEQPPVPQQPPVPEQAPQQPMPQQPPVPEQNPWNGQTSAGQTAQASWQVPQQQTAPQQPPAMGQQVPTYGAPAQPAPQPPVQPQKKSNTGLIVGGVVAVLLVAVIAVLAIFVLPNLNGPSASTSGVDEPSIEEPTEPADDSEPSAPLSDDAEAAVTQAMEAELSKLQNGDPEMLAYIGNMAGDGYARQLEDVGATFENCGIDPDDYATTMLDGLTYSIDDVYVYESLGEATVYVTVTCRDVFDLLDNWEYMLKAYWETDDYQYTTIEEDYQRYGIIFTEATEAAEMNGGYSFSVDFTYEDGTWVIDSDGWQSELDYLFNVADPV